MAFGDLRGTLTVSTASITDPFNATGSVVVSVGDLIIGVVGEVTNLTTVGVSDNLGNTYTAQNAGTDTGGGASTTGIMFYSRVTVAGTLTTVSADTTASGDNATFPVAVFEGPFATSPLDANPANTSADISSPFICPATGTLSQADELVIAWGTASHTAAWSATSPNLLAIDESTVAPKSAIGYQVVAATTSVAPEFTAGSNPSTCVLGTASFKKAAGSITLAAAGGSYAFTGTAATPKVARKAVAGAGSYAFTGTAATLKVARKVAAGSGSYAITGTAAVLKTTRRIAADAGSYAITGTDAALKVVRKIVADAGAYVITGTDAALVRAGIAYTVAADAGSYAFTGTAATLRVVRKLAAAAGAYIFTGQAATLTYTEPMRRRNVQAIYY